MLRLRLAVVAALVVAPAIVGAAPQASRPNVVASTYDVRLDVQPDGSLDVVESISLVVGADPITSFERTVPGRRTDGFTNVIALMDGQAVPVAIDQRTGLSVRWTFGASANRTHTFEIRYRAVRVLAREIDGPRLVWPALPSRHAYPIESAEVSFFAPSGSVATYVGAEGGEVAPAAPGREGVVIVGTAIEKDRGITVDITFAPNSITPVEPAWFARQDEQMKLLPAWLAAGATLLAVGVGILAMLFARLPKAASLAQGEAVSREWIDPERVQARRWLMITGWVLIAAGVIGAVAVVAADSRLGAAPAVVPFAIGLVGMIYIGVSVRMGRRGANGESSGAG